MPVEMITLPPKKFKEHMAYYRAYNEGYKAALRGEEPYYKDKLFVMGSEEAQDGGSADD